MEANRNLRLSESRNYALFMYNRAYFDKSTATFEPTGAFPVNDHVLEL